MNRRGARRGFALVLALVLVMLALSALQALAALDAGATADAAGGQLALDARALALAAADELLLGFARRANDPARPELFAALRATGLGGPLDPGFTGSWYPAGEARTQLEADRLAVTDGLARRLGGPDRALEIAQATLEIQLRSRAPGWPSPEVRGLVIARARVTARHGARRLERVVERVQGLRLVRLAAGWPLDRTALLVRDARAVLGGAPDAGKRVMASVAGLRDALGQVEPQLPAQARDGMRRVARTADAILAAWDADSDRPDRRTRSWLYRTGEAPVADLTELDVGAIAADAEARFDAARARLTAALEGVRKGAGSDLGDACEAFLAQAETFHRRVRGAIADAWGGRVARGAPQDAFTGAIAPFDAAGAWLAVDDAMALAPLWRRDGAPNGIVSLTAGARRLGDATLWAAIPKRAGSRLVLHVDGDAELAGLTAPPRGLLTVIVRGRASLAGRVEACVLAERGLEIAPGARVRGNLYAHGGPVRLGAGASLEREPALRQPLERARAIDAAAYHAALDPFSLTRRSE